MQCLAGQCNLAFQCALVQCLSGVPLWHAMKWKWHWRFHAAAHAAVVLLSIPLQGFSPWGSHTPHTRKFSPKIAMHDRKALAWFWPGHAASIAT